MSKFYLLIISLSIVSGCAKQPAITAEAHEEAHAEGKVELTKDAQKLAGIEVTTAAYQQTQDSISVPGTVSSTSKGRAVVTPPVAGRVISILVQPGDSVVQGQTLAVLESPELAQAWSSIAEAQRSKEAANSELEQTKSEVDLAEAKLKASTSNLVRQKDFANAGAFSQAPLQQVQTELNEAQSELLSVQKEQASHADQLRRLENLFKEGIVSKSELEAARLELQQDQIRLGRTKARIEIAKSAYDREKNISSRGLLNAKEIQVAEAEVRASHLELQRSKIRTKAAESALKNTDKAIANAQAVYRSNSGHGGASVGRVNLIAPISGTITSLDVTRGQAVDRTQNLLTVENLDSVWITANVPEQDFAKVTKGASVQASFQGREFKGIVQIVGSRVDPKTRSIPIQCLIEGAADLLKPGMFATVNLGIGTLKKELVVPKTTIVTEGSKTFVFVKEDDHFEKREVTLGTENSDKIAIKTGIKESEQIASKGAFVLTSQLKKDELKGHED